METGGDSSQRKAKYLIPTYCEYVNKYILQAAAHGKGAIPGEHHFVGVYLLPRLNDFSFPGVPHYVNPDGMKASAGDVVYFSYAPHKDIYYVPTSRLKIEVKLESPIDRSFQLTRTQYYLWIKQEWPPEKIGPLNRSDHPEQPDIFLGASQHGVAIMPWARFREVFIREVYPNGLNDIPRITGRPSPTGAFPMSRFEWAERDGQHYFPYSKLLNNWPELESSLVESLRRQCSDLTSGTPVQPLQVRADI